MTLNEDGNKIIGGLVGDGLQYISDYIAKGMVEGFTTIVNYILGAGFWICKLGVLLCVLLYICSHDQKTITAGFKFAFCYLIIAIIGNAI